MPIETVEKVVATQIRSEFDRALRTNRHWAFYFKTFRYFHNLEELKNKRILDLGAGDSDFVSTLNDSELVDQAVKLDPKYATIPPDDSRNAIAGVGQFLPFKDGSFDELVASWSVFWVTTSLGDVLREMLRVTKGGGRIQIFPTRPRNAPHLHHIPAQVQFGYYDAESNYWVLEITKDTTLDNIEGDEVINNILSSVLFSGGEMTTEPLRSSANSYFKLKHDSRVFYRDKDWIDKKDKSSKFPLILNSAFLNYSFLNEKKDLLQPT